MLETRAVCTTATEAIAATVKTLMDSGDITERDLGAVANYVSGGLAVLCYSRHSVPQWSGLSCFAMEVPLRHLVRSSLPKEYVWQSCANRWCRSCAHLAANDAVMVIVRLTTAQRVSRTVCLEIPADPVAFWGAEEWQDMVSQVERDASFKTFTKKSVLAMSTTNCNRCGKPANENNPLKKCSACRKAWYCSSECQKMDWPAHKKGCRHLRS